eukprot:CAMPEP_0170616514 /NCGR_PEP_ID=MMETSP0224-20130122/25909_1 /TAXON_ID=285029 /ORGANISM="Togula jolla, Strain CCCM 725" /LENGTH=328 /DNA_ID=CAMNT_0010942313 /DNA_START=41 /DNA_END=1028 /DNA_ORIENTATION=+
MAISKVFNLAASSLQQRRARTGQLRINCAKVLPHRTALRNTEQVGGYVLNKELGHGSSGRVWQAFPVEGANPVAIKLARADDPDVNRVIQDELEILRGVDHSNIIKAMEFFTIPGWACLVLECFEGCPLDLAVRDTVRGSEGVRGAAEARMLMDTLGYLHQRSIIHRDIKPANILVSPDKKDIRLIDFGTAIKLAEAESLTVTGTRLYSAPEILQGEAASAAGDMWGCGLCLHMLLTGDLPQQWEKDIATGSYEGFVRTVSSSEVALDGQMWFDMSDSCIAVVRSCLMIDASMRGVAAELLTLQWLQVATESAAGLNLEVLHDCSRVI